MTIKQSILNLLSGGNQYHYLVISKKLKKNPAVILVMLSQLKEDGKISTPTFTVIKNKRGFYQIEKGE